MFFPIKDREDLQNLNKLISFQIEVKAVRLQDKLCKQKFHEDMKKVFEPVTRSFENTSQDITKIITETSNKNNQAMENLNGKILELVNDKGMIAPYLASSLVNLFKPENKRLFR